MPQLSPLSNRHGILDAHGRIANGVIALADGRFTSLPSGISSITADLDGSAFLASSYDGRVYASEIAPACALAVPSLMSQPS